MAWRSALVFNITMWSDQEHHRSRVAEFACIMFSMSTNTPDIPTSFGRTSTEFSIVNDEGRTTWTEAVPPSSLDDMIDLILERVHDRNARVGSNVHIGNNVLVEVDEDHLSFYPVSYTGDWTDDPALLVDVWD